MGIIRRALSEPAPLSQPLVLSRTFSVCFRFLVVFFGSDRMTSAYPRLPVSDECSDTGRNRGANRRGERTFTRQNHRIVAGLVDRPKVFLADRRTGNCYGIGEMPAPNRQGAVTNMVCSSHGNDTDSDGACVTGPQPYSEGENESFAGMLPVPSECGLEPERSGSPGWLSGGRMPRPSGCGGGHSPL